MKKMECANIKYICIFSYLQQMKICFERVKTNWKKRWKQIYTQNRTLQVVLHPLILRSQILRDFVQLLYLFQWILNFYRKDRRHILYLYCSLSLIESTSGKIK